MIECIRTAARDSKTERIKVSCLDIIVTMIGKKAILRNQVQGNRRGLLSCWLQFL